MEADANHTDFGELFFVIVAEEDHWQTDHHVEEGHNSREGEGSQNLSEHHKHQEEEVALL